MGTTLLQLLLWGGPPRQGRPPFWCLKEALSLIDVALLDRLIIGESLFSFSEHGLL
jgi:hypothetical protein